MARKETHFEYTDPGEMRLRLIMSNCGNHAAVEDAMEGAPIAGVFLEDSDLRALRDTITEFLGE